MLARCTASRSRLPARGEPCSERRAVKATSIAVLLAVAAPFRPDTPSATNSPALSSKQKVAQESSLSSRTQPVCVREPTSNSRCPVLSDGDGTLCREGRWLFAHHAAALLLAVAHEIDAAVDAPNRAHAERNERLLHAHAGNRERTDQVEQHARQVCDQAEGRDHHMFEAVKLIVLV